MMIGKGVDNVNMRMPEDAYDAGDYVFSVYLTAIVRDSKGNIIQVHRQRSHSPTANFIWLFLPLTWYSNTGTSYTITNITGGTCSYAAGLGGNAQDISYPSNNPDAMNPTYFLMIQVGSGSQPNPYSAYSLAAPISNGSGSGQLSYNSASLPTTIVVNGNSAYFYITQSYSNVSGATINITEVGIILQLVIQTYTNTASTNCGPILVWYDVLSSPISVPNNSSVTIYYTFVVNP